MTEKIEPWERAHLRELARKQAEYAALPLMEERARLWRAHNDIEGVRPMIYTDTTSFEKEILPPLECATSAAKEMELELKRNVLNHERIGDDRVVSSYYAVAPVTEFKYFDITLESVHALSSSGDNTGERFICKIGDLGEDLPRLKPSSWYYDKEGTSEKIGLASETFGDILKVRTAPLNPKFTLTRAVVHLMGMENMYLNMLDYPDEFAELLRRMTDDYLAYCRWLQSEGLLTLNHDICDVWPTTHGFTSQLPAPGFDGKVRTEDLWLGMDSQETIAVSPQMYRDVFFEHYRRMASYFGRLNYGCCEPVDRVWQWVATLHGLSKVSVSPWCDVHFMGEALRGRKTIFHRKIRPNYVGVGEKFDEEGFASHIREALLAAKGCEIEFAGRDVYTLCGDQNRARRAVEIIRAEIDRQWQG